MTANFGKGFSGDSKLLPRVRDYIANRRELDEADEIAFALQNKYPEYARKKRAPFIKMIEEALSRLGVSGGQTALPSVAAAASANSRKRKAPSAPIRPPEEITLSDEESAMDVDLNTRNNNAANRSMTNLYARTQEAESSNETPQDDLLSTPTTLPRVITSTSTKPKIKKKVSNIALISTVSSTPRGLNQVRVGYLETRTTSKTFADIGSCSKQKNAIIRLAIHLKKPNFFSALGVDLPHCLIHGPPGCGKSTFALALAGELRLPFLQLAVTELYSGVSGETENQIRELFQAAKQAAPCLLILDDIDSIAPGRETATRAMERRVVTQLGACLDDLNGGVFVIGTTSRIESVDGGLRRAGRFREIAIGIPDKVARREILEVVCKQPLHPPLTLQHIANMTPGYVGADLCALVSEAVGCAVNRVLDTLIDRNPSTSRRPTTDAQAEEEMKKILPWLMSAEDTPLSEEEFMLTLQDFQRALEDSQPSAMREGFATVPDVTWDDIGALKPIREELLWNIVFPVRHAEEFDRLGVATKASGVLLCGPPGCGKTLVAKAIANESGINFISVKGPELLNMYVGESERAVRTVFQRARDSSPCVIFFDEIDALCARRNSADSSGSARLVNQMLTEMDGVEGRKQVFLIGATNKPDILDKAILRPGRLDKILYVGLPDADERADILKKITKQGQIPKCARDVNFDQLAKSDRMDGLTGADLAAVVHQAGILAVKESRTRGAQVDCVSLAHFEEASSALRPSISAEELKRYEKMETKYGCKGSVADAP